MKRSTFALSRINPRGLLSFTSPDEKATLTNLQIASAGNPV
jgi:hypothetical protein